MASENIHTYCAMCISRCGVLARLEDGRFTKVTADPSHPNGCICVKGSAAPEIVYSPDRLKQPMKRTRPKGDPDPGWVPISWDEALQMAADRLTEIKARYGPEAVVFGRATPAGNATFDFDPWVQRLANVFGSPNLFTTTHICTWNRMFGAKLTYGFPTPPPDFENTSCILLWGINPQATSPTAAKRISAARARGAKLIVIDPRGHALAEKADCWLRVRPGSDGALALSMIHVLLEEQLYDEAFVRNWTNGPFLVREDTGRLLTARDLSSAGAPDAFVAWNTAADKPIEDAGRAAEGVKTALTGRFSLRLADGAEIRCRPAFDLLSDAAHGYAPERTSATTWVPAEDVRQAVRLFAEEQPSCYTTWAGLELHRDAMQMNRAVACFYALTGQFDRCGSNVLVMPPQTRPVAGADLLPREKAARRLGLSDHPLGPPSDPGIVQAAQVYQAILSQDPYAVKAMVLFGSDPLLGHGDADRGKRALEALDFYVHVDIFANPSAAFADLLLPASTAWEWEAPRPAFGGTPAAMGWSQLRKAVIPPLHDSRPDLEIIFELADRLGLGEHFFSGDIEEAWDHHLEPLGLTMAQLRANPLGVGAEKPGRYQKYSMVNPETGRARGFPTPTGKLELYSNRLAAAGYEPLPTFEGAVDGQAEEAGDYPLVLTSFRLLQFIDQQHRNIPRLRGRVREPFVELHPDTAAASGISNGDEVLVETALATVTLKAKYNGSLDPRVVAAPYGWWQECRELDLPGYDPFGPAGANVNRLIPNSDVDPISASVAHRSQMCRVRKAPPAA